MSTSGNLFEMEDSSKKSSEKGPQIMGQNTSQAPLAERMRPRSLAEVIGQEHLLAEGKPLSVIHHSNYLPSILFWGPPGCGKTTLSRLLAKERPFFQVSAVLSGVQDLRSIIQKAKEQPRAVLFVDEIHRWNKAQQDALLPHIEDGTIVLIGATTENPSFEIIAPLMSRCKLFVLQALGPESLRMILKKALQEDLRGLGNKAIEMDEDALDALILMASGDARQALNMLEIASHFAPKITLSLLAEAFEKRSLRHDKKGESHYDTISAFIKSMRGSDPDAAVYYLARLYESGEDPLFIARRMIIFASEDVSNADPRALQIAVSAFEAFERVGTAEGWIPLAQAVVYLATAPKSNASYMAYKNAKEDVEKYGDLPIPLHLRNAPTSLMKKLEYGKGYEYAHNQPDARVHHTHLPEKLVGKHYYQPTTRGYEKNISERLFGKLSFTDTSEKMDSREDKEKKE